MAATQSFGAILRPNKSKRANDIARGDAEVTHLRLRLDDEDTLRYVFCDWERECGVRSNHTAQVEALIDRSFQRSVDAAEREVKRAKESGSFEAKVEKAAGIRLALDVRQFRKSVPFSMRGWPSENVRIAKTGGAVIRNDREAQPQRWTHSKQGKTGPEFREKTLRTYRALVTMAERGDGGHGVVLFKLYGPRDPAADYLRWPDWAPIAHLTKTAEDLAVRATRALRRAIAEQHAAKRFAGLSLEVIQAERLSILDRATRTLHKRGPDGEPLKGPDGKAVKDPMRIHGDSVAVFEARLDDLDRRQARLGEDSDRAGWIERRVAAERATVEPRDALEAHFRRIGPDERTKLVEDIDTDAGVMLAKAATAFYGARAVIA